MVLVAKEAVQGDGFGENALGAKVANLTVEGTLGGALAIESVAGGVDGAGQELPGLPVGRTGDGFDEAAESIDRPVWDVGPGDAVWNDLGGGERIDLEAADLLGDGGEDQVSVAAGEHGIWRTGGEALKGAELGTGASETLEDVVDGIDALDGKEWLSFGEHLDVRAHAGSMGDVLLERADAAEAPEDERDALGEGDFDLADGGEVGEGGLEMLLPAGSTFEAGKDRNGGEETAAGGVLTDDGLAV